MNVARLNPDDLFLMSNLTPKHTGLPYVVWISISPGADDDVSVWVSRDAKAVATEMVRVAIQPNVRVLNGKLSASDLNLLQKWVELNRDVLIRHWACDITFSENAIDAIRPIEPK